MYFKDTEGKIANPWDYEKLEEVEKKAPLGIHILW